MDDVNSRLDRIEAMLLAIIEMLTEQDEECSDDSPFGRERHELEML